MNEERRARLTDAELKSLFDELFPHGFAGPDVLAEIAPEGWEKSPLRACFHPSPEQVYKEQVQVHRNLEETYSPSESFAREREERERQEELKRLRAELAAADAQARREAMDRPPPPAVQAYQERYGRDPQNWPPT